MSSAAHSRPLWLVLAGGFLLLLLFVIAVRLLLGFAPAPDEDAARAAERVKAHQELEAENAQKLQNYAWVDKAKGTVQVPIERAMELAIVELNSKKPTAAGPIATPAPSPATSPAAGSTASPQLHLQAHRRLARQHRPQLHQSRHLRPRLRRHRPGRPRPPPRRQHPRRLPQRPHRLEIQQRKPRPIYDNSGLPPVPRDLLGT